MHVDQEESVRRMCVRATGELFVFEVKLLLPVYAATWARVSVFYHHGEKVRLHLFCIST